MVGGKNATTIKRHGKEIQAIIDSGGQISTITKIATLA